MLCCYQQTQEAIEDAKDKCKNEGYSVRKLGSLKKVGKQARRRGGGGISTKAKAWLLVR